MPQAYRPARTAASLTNSRGGLDSSLPEAYNGEMDVLAEAMGLLATPPGTNRLIVWGLVGMLATLVVGVILFAVLRRYFLAPEGYQSVHEQGFTMSDLEGLHAAGQLSDEEFRALRAGLLGVGDSPPKTQERSSSGVSGDDDGETGGDEPRSEKET